MTYTVCWRFAPDIHSRELPSILFAALYATAAIWRYFYLSAKIHLPHLPARMSVRKAPKCVAILKAPSFVLTWSARGKKRAVEETCSEDEHVSEASSSTSIGAPRSARAREKQPAMPPVKKRMCLAPYTSSYHPHLWPP